MAYSGWAYFSLAVTQTSPYIYSCFYFLFSSLALFYTTLDIKTIATHQYLHDYPVITGKIRLSLYIYFFNLFTSSLFGLLGVWMEWLGNHLSRLGEIHSLEQVIERSTEQPVTIKRSMEFDTDDAIGEK